MSSRKQSLLSRAESSSQQRLPHMQQLGGAGRVRQDPPSAVCKLCEKRGRTEHCGVAVPQENLLQNLRRPLPTHTELLVWYGDEYGKELGIKWGTQWKSNAPAQGNQECMSLFI
ncbi:hypothetical protein FKM82_025446 [Ascaphus truei]